MSKRPSPREKVLKEEKQKYEMLLERLRGVKRTIEYLEESLGITKTPLEVQAKIFALESRRLENMSGAKACEIVLREHGNPMLLKDIVKEIKKSGFGKDRTHTQLYRSLFTTLRTHRSDVFKRTGVGEFGLVEWKRIQTK